MFISLEVVRKNPLEGKWKHRTGGNRCILILHSHFICIFFYRRSRPKGQKHHHPVASTLYLRSRPVYEFYGQISLELECPFLMWVSGVSRCIQHPPRIPSQLETRELGTGVIPLALFWNVATIMATILLLSIVGRWAMWSFAVCTIGVEVLGWGLGSGVWWISRVMLEKQYHDIMTILLEFARFVLCCVWCTAYDIDVASGRCRSCERGWA